jgi:hypothetical protein
VTAAIALISLIWLGPPVALLAFWIAELIRRLLNGYYRGNRK